MSSCRPDISVTVGDPRRRGGCGTNVTLKFPRSPAREDVAGPSDSRHSPETILCLLQNDEGFRDHLPKNITPTQFCAIDQIDPGTLSLWTASTTGPPRVCCAAECWSPREPTFEELWIQSNKINRTGKVNQRWRLRDGTLRRWVMDSVKGFRQRRAGGSRYAAGVLSTGTS